MKNEQRKVFRTCDLPNHGVGDATQEMYDELCDAVARDLEETMPDSERARMQAMSKRPEDHKNSH